MLHSPSTQPYSPHTQLRTQPPVQSVPVYCPVTTTAFLCSFKNIHVGSSCLLPVVFFLTVHHDNIHTSPHTHTPAHILYFFPPTSQIHLHHATLKLMISSFQSANFPHFLSAQSTQLSNCDLPSPGHLF